MWSCLVNSAVLPDKSIIWLELYAVKQDSLVLKNLVLNNCLNDGQCTKNHTHEKPSALVL